MPLKTLASGSFAPQLAYLTREKAEIPKSGETSLFGEIFPMVAE